MRIIVTSSRARDAGIALLSAIALALAFPKANLPWLAPFGAAGLFWLWQGHSWKRALWTGWFAGAVFIALSFSWVTNTVGSALGSLSFLVVLIIALVEGAFFGLAGAGAALAYRWAPLWAAPLAASAAFVAFEWARSVGTLGVPFEQLGYSQADTPLAVFAAYIGTYGVSFVVCIIGAYLASALGRERRRDLAIALIVIAGAWTLAYAAWPARRTAAPSIRVAAIQGNIAQTMKMQAGSSAIAIRRYVNLTRRARAFAPALVLWPETVITAFTENDPALMARFATLARTMHTTLVLGSWDLHDRRAYNALYVFEPHGELDGIYDKRQLVPYAESFPGRELLGWLPDASLIGGWSNGHQDTVFEGPLRFAPLICWESAFADLAHAQARNGAALFLIATDDAWFGTTAGPYQHAQIAQMRAIENGTWVLRAASTGISGIIAPDGTYAVRSALDRQAVVLGRVGEPPGSAFARVGPSAIVAALCALYGVIVLTGAATIERGRRDA